MHVDTVVENGAQRLSRGILHPSHMEELALSFVPRDDGVYIFAAPLSLSLCDFERRKRTIKRLSGIECWRYIPSNA